MDDLKNFMSTMKDAIMQQVSEQVKKVVEAASSVRPLPRFEYVPTIGCEPSHRHDPVVSLRHSERMREAPYLNGDRQTRGKTKTVPLECHMTAVCQELRKALHELADKGQINRFLKRGLQFLRKEHEPAQSEPQDEECSTEIVTIITGGYIEGITRSA
ncbi:hypothetical protein Cgig2_012995 [Carnegiea gigantea]|uniref:Uncharacterized protein n=1 Tax=Carnegiea gigantea TaxID=171969 RepID=A0A9Q1K9R7_9CARY|nr:hypothetical protein Cgig2_012995 [Carnegiea gigantea]